MKLEKLIYWFRTPKDRPDPVLPRLWHGPATPVPKGFKIPAADLAKYGIDPAHVAKFKTFSNAVDS